MRTEPYVDILPRERLDLVIDALQDALRSEPRSVWPIRAGVHDLDERCVIVPLARLGIPEGRSGASVFIAYFIDRGGTYLPSQPLVVKVGPRAKLEPELQRARSWPSHPDDGDAGFAFPWRVFPVVPEATSETATTSDCVLIAQFSSVRSLRPEGTSYDLEIRDLWRGLVDPSSGIEVEPVLRSVYELMHGIHRSGRVAPRRGSLRYGEAYDLYLRGMHTARRREAEALFGTEPSIILFGQTWPNPLCLVDELCTMTVEGVIGPIHGDLHPKNVVVDRTRRPRVIDFGWARENGHVLIDYLLMEINLRALTLPAHVSHDDVLALAAMVDRTDDAPTRPGEIVLRAGWIRDVLWSKARNAGLVRDWATEYLVPQFLIAFGLLKFLEDAKNQVALLCTVLCLAKRIRDTGLGALRGAVPP